MKKLISIAALTATAFSASAELRINGFANLIGGITSSDETLYGYNDDISFDDESLFAIQFIGTINDSMTATGQLVSRGNDDYEAKFDWAYIAYQATDNLTVSAGRFRLPLFNYSASSDIGYSYHWVAAPKAVYNVPFENIDGVKLDYANYAGDWEYTFSGALGTFKDDSEGRQTEGSNTVLVSAEATYEYLKLRAVAGRAAVSVDFANADSDTAVALQNGLQSLAMFGFTDLSDSLAIDDDNATFAGVSINYDRFDWFVGAELTKITIKESFAGDDEALYVTAGMRTGKWTPSLTYETFETEPEIKFQSQIDQLAASTALPDTVKAQFMGLVVGAQLAQETKYNVTTATLRYDYDANIAFKIDISKRDDKLDDDLDATLVRVAVNYVF